MYTWVSFNCDSVSLQVIQGASLAGRVGFSKIASTQVANDYITNSETSSKGSLLEKDKKKKKKSFLVSTRYTAQGPKSIVLSFIVFIVYYSRIIFNFIQ